MSRDSYFEFNWAKKEDDPDIRALIQSVSMPGDVAIRFSREPNYFLGTTIMGNDCDVLTIRHMPEGKLAGIACRAENQAYINGKGSPLGYIGQIRIAPSYRGNWLVNRGADWFKKASPPELLYYGVIASENPRAREYLVGVHPPGNLLSQRISGITTCAIILHPSRPYRSVNVTIQPGTTESLSEIVNFLQLHGPRRQFFPEYTLEDFSGGTKLRGLNTQDILVARVGKKIVGTIAVWDQSKYKQDIVDSYGTGLRRLRPIYDLAARLFKAQPLTPPGKAIPMAFAACICVENDDPEVMRILISAGKKYAFECGKAFLMVGLADNDPLLKIVTRHFHIRYHSDLFAVSWSRQVIDQLDERIPYIEIATL